MAESPVLAEVTRGGAVESAHRGAAAVVDADGGVAFSCGDISRPVFPRSAVKPMQALPLIESGAADRFGFDFRRRGALQHQLFERLCESHDLVDGDAAFVSRVGARPATGAFVEL